MQISARIDDELISGAQKVFGTSSKTDAITKALRYAIETRSGAKDLSRFIGVLSTTDDRPVDLKSLRNDLFKGME